MAIEFDNKMSEWQNKGLPPDTDLRKTGFRGGYKPPAHIFNWFWSLVMAAINEIQIKLSAVDDKCDAIGIVYDAENKAIEVGGGSAQTGGGGTSGSGYVLTAATKDRLGGVKIGKGLDVEEDGTSSVDYEAIPTATSREIKMLFEQMLRRLEDE